MVRFRTNGVRILMGRYADELMFVWQTFRFANTEGDTMRKAFVALAAVLLVAGHARASFITYSFTGTVTTAVDYSPGQTLLPLGIQPGSTFTGTFSFDNSATGAQYLSDEFPRGTSLKLSATVTIDSKYTFKLTTPTSSDEIDVILGSFNGFEYFKRGPNTPTDFNANTYTNLVDFLLGTSSPQALTNVLSGSNVNLADYNGPSLGLSGMGPTGSEYFFIGGTITSLQPASAQPVPEPASWAILSIGGAFSVVLRRFCRRSA
jgi:hypothetical protein